jgi:hypothetical protein
MTNQDLHAQQARATAFATEHLAACAADIIEWERTSVLPDGRMRELITLCAFVGSSRQAYAKEEVNRQVLRLFAAQSQAKQAFSAADYARQQVTVAQQRDDTLRDDSKWRLDLWFYHGGTAFHEMTPYGIASAAWTASREALAEQVNEMLEDDNKQGKPAALAELGTLEKEVS